MRNLNLEGARSSMTGPRGSGSGNQVGHGFNVGSREKTSEGAHDGIALLASTERDRFVVVTIDRFMLCERLKGDRPTVGCRLLGALARIGDVILMNGDLNRSMAVRIHGCVESVEEAWEWYFRAPQGERFSKWLKRESAPLSVHPSRDLNDSQHRFDSQT